MGITLCQHSSWSLLCPVNDILALSNPVSHPLLALYNSIWTLEMGSYRWNENKRKVVSKPPKAWRDVSETRGEGREG